MLLNAGLIGMLRNMFKDLLLIVAAATLLCYQAFNNHFPLTFDDTGSYLYSGFMNEMPQDRPIIYGLFLRLISIQESLWLPIFAQALILAYLIFLSFKYLVSVPQKRFWYLCLLAILAFFTGASINVSELIPDFFTPVMLLCFALLLVNQLKLAEKIFIAIIVVFSISTHNTHGLIGLIALSLYTIGVLIWKTGGHFKTSWKPLLMTWLLCFTGIFAIPAVNYLFDGHFSANQASHVFKMYKLNETGILDDYLKRNCDTKHWKICAYKEAIPTNFIWDKQNSPVYKEGGWDSTKAEYDSIISDIFSDPRYVKWFVEKAAVNSMEQLFTFSAGPDLPQNTSETSPYFHIKLFFPGDIRQLEMCKQYNHGLNFNWMNNWQMMLVIVSSLLLLFILFFRSEKISTFLSRTGLILLIGIFANAIVCGSLSKVVDRYQLRVIWLLPLFVFMLLLEQPAVFSLWRNGILKKEESDK